MRISRRYGQVAVVIMALLVALVAGDALAAPVITVMAPGCLPPKGNGIVTAMVQPPTGLGSVRVYFRKAGSPDFYYLEMRSAGNGTYWAALPRPEEGTKIVEYQVAAQDSQGKETRSTLQKVDVLSSCKPVLTPDQSTAAQNLVVGETTLDQHNRSVLGFLCPGIISRIDFNGQIRSDEYCRQTIIAGAAGYGVGNKWLTPLLVGAGAGWAGAVISREKTECSCSNPPCTIK
jgi:hypothetical protein